MPLVLLSGCAITTAGGPVRERYAKAAVEQYATQYACPTERQIVRLEPPSPEIAGDSARLALWQKGHHVYRVDGCGQSVVLVCNIAGGDLVNPWVVCSSVPELFRAAEKLLSVPAP